MAFILETSATFLQMGDALEKRQKTLLLLQNRKYFRGRAAAEIPHTATYSPK
jgi:hypothetical protein